MGRCNMNSKFHSSILIMLISVLYSALTCSMESSLSNIREFNKKERSALRSRYGGLGENLELFAKAQLVDIARNNLSPVIAKLILHKQIKLNDAQDVVDYAQEIAESGHEFFELEPRIIKYMDKGELAFGALSKAIARESFHQWRLAKINEVVQEENAFVEQLKDMGLNKSDETRVIKVYATCVASFTKSADRERMAPKICGALDEYDKPRHVKYPVSVREKKSSQGVPRVWAYRHLIAAAQRVSEQYDLDTFEKIIMAKCIAEQSLRFLVPAHHPFKALHKTMILTSKSPEHAFFMDTGICSTFSSIAYVAANELGLKGNVFLAKRGVHVYLEFQANGEWYHTHPFNSHSSCDINRF